MREATSKLALNRATAEFFAAILNRNRPLTGLKK